MDAVRGPFVQGKLLQIPHRTPPGLALHYRETAQDTRSSYDRTNAPSNKVDVRALRQHRTREDVCERGCSSK